MQIKRAIISCFLLFTYSLGFAHNLIPHCQELVSEIGIFSNAKDGHHHLEHHTHVEIEDLDEDDILHENHLDDSLYDFIVCLLSEMEHPVNECQVEHSIPSTLNDDLSKQLSKTKIIAVLCSVWGLTNPNESLSEYNSEAAVQYSSPPLCNSPNRGPPSISC